MSFLKSILCFHNMSTGGLAGGISNAILYPIDTIKTMQQSDKSIKGFKSAIVKLRTSNGGIFKLYSGFWAAVLGSVPSSAIYFGSYETSKRVLFNNCRDKISRPVIHMMAAASGNIMSSFVFVPKDVIKQRMQAIKTGSIPWVRMSPFYSPIARNPSSVTLLEVMKSIMKKEGLRGFYPNYGATLMRNIPSAVVSSNTSFLSHIYCKLYSLLLYFLIIHHLFYIYGAISMILYYVGILSIKHSWYIIDSDKWNFVL